MSHEAAAAARAGCTVVVPPRSGRALIVCPGGWGAARLLVELARDDLDVVGEWIGDARGRLLCELGRAIASESRSAIEHAARVHALVQRAVCFVPEVGEIFQHPTYTLARGYGDCDDHVRVVTSLLRAGGVPARLVFLAAPGSDPRHVVAQAYAGGRWWWLETTVPTASFGEHPVQAAQRAGVLREDIGPAFSVEVAMGESFGVEGGQVYRARLLVPSPRDALEVRPDEFIRRALEDEGFADVTVWEEPRELPADFRADARGDTAASGVWNAWVEATYARPECRGLDREIANGAIIVEAMWPRADDASIATSSSTSSTIGAVDAASDDAPLEIVHTRDLPDRFFVELKRIMRALEMPAEWGLVVMMHESGISPTARLPRSGPSIVAAGLIGFTRALVPDLVALVRESAVDQLPIVARFWAPLRGKITSAANLYQYNFIPASLSRGVGAATVVAARDGTGYGGHEAEFYADNAALDVDRDGKITVADLARRLDGVRSLPRYVEAAERLRRAPDPSTFPIAIVVPFLALGSYVLQEILRG